MLKRVDFDQRLAPIYHDARRLNPETARTWMDEVRRAAPGPGPLRVLDLGSGTGRFSPLLADEFNGLVTAVEPARGMREQARLRSGHPSVSYVAAAAENLPLATESIDIAFAFMIWHHVADRHRATAEVARVLRPDGVVFLRTNFADRIPDLAYFRWWPEARDIERQLFVPLDEVTAEFAAARVAVVELRTVTTLQAQSIAAYAQRLAQRPFSIFDQLSEPVIERGLDELRRAAEEEKTPSPIYDTVDVLVLRKR